MSGAGWVLTLKNLFLPVFCRDCGCALLTEENGFFCPDCWAPPNGFTGRIARGAAGLTANVLVLE
jgi:hypothetical protein